MAGELDPNVLRAFPNVQTFNCSSQDITSIEAIGLFEHLRILNCPQNRIASLSALVSCPKLVDIDCRYNQITSLTGLSTLYLKRVLCYDNKLTSLEGLEGSKSLLQVRCSSNKIRSIAALRACSLLQILRFENNQVRSFDGLEDCTALTDISCSGNHLDSLAPLNLCSNLTSIDCQRNRLRDLVGLENKVKLETVQASYNRITSLTGIEGCTTLRVLDVHNNKIRSTQSMINHPNLTRLHINNNHLSELVIGFAPKLDTIDCYKNAIHTLDVTACHLKQLNCNDNCIESLACLSGCNQLQSLDCNNNALRTLDGLQSLPNLRSLSCNSNSLVTLKEVEGCRALYSLDCRNNSITTIAHAIRLRNLRSFQYSGNLIDMRSPQVEHFLYMITARANGTIHIYDNSENVMESAVTKSVVTSIQNLMCDPAPPAFNPSSASSCLNGQTLSLLAKYCRDESVEREFMITYKQLLAYVWQRICKSEHKAELISILEIQVRESNGRCLHGRLSRLVAVLVGFYDDINITISNNAQIYSIIQVTERSLKPYDALTHRTLADTNLRALGYTEAEIQPWLDAIYDPTESE